MKGYFEGIASKSGCIYKVGLFGCCMAVTVAWLYSTKGRMSLGRGTDIGNRYLYLTLQQKPLYSVPREFFSVSQYRYSLNLIY